MELKQYGVYGLKAPVQGRVGFTISDNSNVVLLDFEKNNHVRVCRFGNYLESVTISKDLLTKSRLKK